MSRNRLRVDCDLIFTVNLKKGFTNLLSVNKFKDIINSQAVYAIRNKLSGKLYIGSCSDFYFRLFRGRSHRQHFLSGDHSFINSNNIHEFEIVYLCNCNGTKFPFRQEVEQRYIRLLKTYDPRYGYNKESTGKGGGNAPHFWINNGKINSRVNSLDDLPEGFVIGRLSAPNKGSIPINNWRSIKFHNPDLPIPKGWVYGMVKKNLYDIINKEYNNLLLDRTYESEYSEVVFDMLTLYSKLGISRDYGHWKDKLAREALELYNIKFIIRDIRHHKLEDILKENFNVDINGSQYKINPDKLTIITTVKYLKSIKLVYSKTTGACVRNLKSFCNNRYCELILTDYDK